MNLRFATICNIFELVDSLCGLKKIFPGVTISSNVCLLNHCFVFHLKDMVAFAVAPFSFCFDKKTLKPHFHSPPGKIQDSTNL